MGIENLDEKKKIIMEVISGEMYVPMKVKELAILLNVPKDRREELHYVVNLLEDEGKLVVTKRGKIMVPDGAGSDSVNIDGNRNGFIEGIFESNQRGFGFVRVEGEEDIFIPESFVHGAMHTDKVRVKITECARGGQRREGEIVKIIERGTNEIVGIYRKSKSFGFVDSIELSVHEIVIDAVEAEIIKTGHDNLGAFVI